MNKPGGIVTSIVTKMFVQRIFFFFFFRRAIYCRFWCQFAFLATYLCKLISLLLIVFLIYQLFVVFACGLFTCSATTLVRFRIWFGLADLKHIKDTWERTWSISFGAPSIHCLLVCGTHYIFMNIFIFIPIYGTFMVDLIMEFMAPSNTFPANPISKNWRQLFLPFTMQVCIVYLYKTM